MGIRNLGSVITGKAEAAMTATEYRFVKLGTNAEEVAVCGAGELPLGIRQNTAAVGEGVEVQVAGVAKLTVGSGGCTKGAYLKSGAAGEAIATTTDKNIVGAIALEAGDENDVISVQIQIFTLSI